MHVPSFLREEWQTWREAVADFTSLGWRGMLWRIALVAAFAALGVVCALFPPFN